MKRASLFSLLAWMTSIALVWAEPGQSSSHVAYLYPAGARQGATVEITAGGRGLRNIKEVLVSGEGIRATALHTTPNFKKAYGDFLRLYQNEARQREAAKNRKGGKARPLAKKDQEKKDELGPLPDHPVFRNLKGKSSQELGVLLRRFYKENTQKTREMDELVLIKLIVDPKAAPGMREVRLLTNGGLSNPIRFFIGEKPEILEREPNERTAANAPLKPPFLLNGQIAPGDIDRFDFTASEGQQLLIQAHARSIIPYIADAVPGWFQATLSLHDSEGRELAYADDYRFSPDPVLFYKIPENGTYTVQIRDSIYRGREDFVYRISVGEDPFITQIFPLGGSKTRNTKVTLEGWNLLTKTIDLDTDRDPGTTQQFSIEGSNRVPYAVDELPECFEAPDNDSPESAQKIATPIIINGRIEKPGDTDVYEFSARPGDRIIVEVNARRLHSPMDSKLRLTDAAGNVIASNDDVEQVNIGMQTHHADSRLSARLPKEGRYFVHIADTQSQGGPEYGYRLRISRPIPDFTLNSTPASISVRQNCTVPITVHAIRRDGYDGKIDIVLKDAPKGFKLGGSEIPEGSDSVQITLTAPAGVRNTLFSIRLQGRAKVGRHVVVRDVIPGEAMTQAFITEHVMPFQQTMVHVGGWGEAPEVLLSKSGRVRIPQGGETSLHIKKTKSSGSLVLKLYQAPEGITLEQKRAGNNSLSVSLKADEKMEPETSGNLMIEVFRETKRKDGKVQQISLGVMPAVPFSIEEN